MARRHRFPLPESAVFAIGAILAIVALAFFFSREGDPSQTARVVGDGGLGSQTGDPAGPEPTSSVTSVAGGEQPLEAKTTPRAGQERNGNEACADASTECEEIRLVASQPEAGAVDVDPQAGFRLQFDNSLADSEEMEVVLQEIGSQRSVSVPAALMSIDLTRQNVSFAFRESLSPSADYELTVRGLVTVTGTTVPPIQIGFRTGKLTGGSDHFAVVKLADLHGATGVTFGPDGNAYATSVAGQVVRFDLDSTGRPTGEQTVVVSNPDYQFIAIDFEPGSKTQVWISQWSNQPTDEFSSEIAAYDVTIGAESEQKKVVGLPRHPNGNHSVQGLDFHNGRLYAAIGSVTAGGARSDTYFGDPVLFENPISASILEIDYRSIDSPVDTTAISVDASSSPVRLFATGTRNAYDLVWHSNGNLYSNVNQNGGSSDENSAPPTGGACEGMPGAIASNEVADTLNLIKRGRYYGHPNPSRGECVVMGGGQGRFAVGGYDSSQAPDPDFDERLIVFYSTNRSGSFGISVNGIDEYRGSGPLSGALLSADFSGSRSILVARLGSPTSELTLGGPIDRIATSTGEAATFLHPLDVASSHTGHLLVADFGEWLGGRFGDNGSIYFLEAAGN